MRFPVELLVVVCLVVGIFPVITIGPFLHTAVVAVLGLDSPAYSLALWHGFTLPLLMSVIALIGGVTLYAVLHTYMPRRHSSAGDAPVYGQADFWGRLRRVG